MAAAKTLTVADVTARPKTRPAKTEDGVETGMHVTLTDSIAMSGGKIVRVPAGSLISGPISGGIDIDGCTMTTRCKLGLGGPDLVFRF